jgi:hypothetical protein
MILRNRQKQIPNGLRYYQAQTKWVARPGSFSSIVDQVIAHRQANPWLRQSIDRPTVENEVDLFNANLCAQQGWSDYIVGGDPPASPQSPPPGLANRLANVAGASPVLVEWIASGAEAVPNELANSRARTCCDIDGKGTRCPMNEAGDLLRFFTVPVSEAIRSALNSRREMKLSTSRDDDLHVCTACSCPLKLMVHIPLERKLKALSAEAKSRLHSKCWVLREEADK